MNRVRFAFLLGAVLLVAMVSRDAAKAEASTQSTSTPGSEEVTTLPAGAPLVAELDSSLDSKKAKIGDPVAAHTTEALKANGKMLLPKNVKLLGHITQSSARSKGDPSSALAIQFDKAVVKKGQEIPLKVVIQAIAASPRISAEASPDPTVMPTGTAAAQGSPMGAPHGTPSGGSPSPARPDSSVSSTTSTGTGVDASNGANAGLDNSGRLTPNSRGVIGLEGLHLATDKASVEPDSLITTSGKSVHLDSGIKLLLISQ